MIAKISDIFPVCSSNAQLKINATTFFFNVCTTSHSVTVSLMQNNLIPTMNVALKPHISYSSAKRMFTSNKKSPDLSMCLISLRLLSYLKSFREAIEGITDIILCRIILLCCLQAPKHNRIIHIASYSDGKNSDKSLS